MNILVLSDFFNTFYISLVNYLNSRGIGSTIHFASFKEERIEGKSVFFLRLPEIGSYLGDLNKKAILKYVRDNDVDVILFPQISDVEGLIMEVKRINRKIACLFLLHNRPDLVVADKRERFKRLNIGKVDSPKAFFAWAFPRIYLFILKWLWRRWAMRQYSSFDKVIVLSDSYIKEFECVMGGKDSLSKILAIPNPLIEHESHVPIREKKKQIVFVGRLSGEKAIFRLLHIWGKIQKRLPEWSLLFVGDGETREGDEALVGELALERVCFLGFREAIPIIDESSILCLTSNIEGLPTVFVEAMTLGVVPVGFDSFSAIYDMIDNGENGIIVTAFDLDSYAEALVRLALDEELRYRMAENAKAKVRQYDIKYVGEKWVDLFKELNLLQ